MSDPTGKSFWETRYKTRKMVSPLAFTEKTWDYLKDLGTVHLLDIGCGDGRDSQFFAHKGCTVTAIDYAESAIERVNTLDAGIEARVMDITAMDFPDAHFDAIYAHLAIQYFDDTVTTEVFQNIHRMLKPGGLFFVKCKSTEDRFCGMGEKVGEDMYLYDYIRHFFSEDYMREKLERFDIIELASTQDSYDGIESHFIEAVARA
jgi:SAM-dependent methyltransferase